MNTFQMFRNMKREAYKMVQICNRTDHDNDWLKQHVETFVKEKRWENIYRFFQVMVKIYMDYESKRIEKKEAIQLMDDLEKEFINSSKDKDDKLDTDAFEDIFAYQTAMNNAFAEAGKNEGKVSFKCPLCKGQAKAVKTKEGYYSKCLSCGYHVV